MILDEIVKAKRAEVKRAKERRPLAELKAEARDTAPPRPFELRRKGAVSIIAEIKRASPAHGDLRADLDPAGLARRYAEGGASALSVLTDAAFFKGSAGDLLAARGAGLPVLRKDFVIDEYQLWEARTMPADAALLIARILGRRQLQEYAAIAREDLGLPVLVEIHSEKEADSALDAGAEIVGINNRDLDTLQVSLQTAARLRPLLPDWVVAVSESGISSREDMDFLRHLRVDAALIGTELVRSGDPVRRMKELLGAEDAAAGNPGRR